MRYIFKILVFGEPESTSKYLNTVFGEHGAFKDTYIEWNEEMRVLEDTCELDIDLITDPVNMDYDAHLSMSDGIFYFLNPLDKEELDLFLINISVIQSIKRRIPSVIIFYDNTGYISINVIDLFETVWTNYPEMEAYVNLLPHEFHQAFQCLCLAMINVDTPLNIENAWLRYPYFIKLANQYFQEKKFLEAAKAVKKAATIAEIYNMDEFYIISEKSAYLFSQSELFLEASRILEGIDKKKAAEYKNKHMKSQIKKADDLLNQGNYEQAAIQFTNAGQWAALELMDKEVIQHAFKLAIKSWILANDFKKAFSILERLSHNVHITILKEMDGLIISTINSLIEAEKFYDAKKQIEISLKIYQKEGLFDILGELADLNASLLLNIIENEIDDQNIVVAKTIYDELEHFWSAFQVEKINLDLLLEKFVKLVLDDFDIEFASFLITKIESVDLKKELSQYSSKVEEKGKKQKWEEQQAKVKEGVDLLERYVKEEKEIMRELSEKIMKEANHFIENEEYLNAYHHLRNQIEFYIMLDQSEEVKRLTQNLLSILIQGNLLINFFKFYLEFYDKLDVELKKDLLIQNFTNLIKTLKSYAKNATYFRMEKFFEDFYGILRDQSLYQESYELSIFFVNYLKDRMIEILEKEVNFNTIENVLPLLRKANKIINSNIDPTLFNFNKIYEKIATLYISMGNLSLAQEFVDKIDNKEIRSEIFKQIQKNEAEISREMQLSLKANILEERIDSLRQEAQDASINKDVEFRQRSGYKRAFFAEGLKYLAENEYQKAIEIYKESISKLIGIQKYNLAGVSLALLTILYLKDEKSESIKKAIQEFTSDQKLLSETFPIKLVKYINDCIELGKENLSLDALQLLDIFPLFEEERNFFYDFMNWGTEDIQKVAIEEEKFDITQTQDQLEQIISNFNIDKAESAKRKLMKKKYWDSALTAILENELDTASSSYLNHVSELFEKAMDKQALIALTMGIVLLAKEKNIGLAKEALNKHVKMIGKDIEQLKEYKLLDLFLLGLENDASQIINMIINNWIENYYLFSPEKDFLLNFTSKVEERTKKLKKDEEDQFKTSELGVRLDQMLGQLDLKLKASKEEFEVLLKKRRVMRKRYYENLLTDLGKVSFKMVANQYIELFEKFIARKDYITSSLLLTLYGLALMKTNISITDLKRKFEKFLENLGAIRQFVEESFFVKVLQFLLEVKANKLNKFDLNIKRFLNALPLLTEEEVLIEQYI